MPTLSLTVATFVSQRLSVFRFLVLHSYTPQRSEHEPLDPPLGSRICVGLMCACSYVGPVVASVQRCAAFFCGVLRNNAQVDRA